MVASFFTPVKDILIIARPTEWGFLLLPEYMAFAMYWWVKVLFIFMSSLEFFYLVGKRKSWAVLGGIIVLFSEQIQWWLSQDIVYVVASAQYAVVFIVKYLQAEKRKMQIIYAALFAWMTAIYAFSLYPARSVPFAYVMAAVLAAVLIKEGLFKKFISLRGAALIICGVVPTVLLIAHFFTNSAEAINTTLNSDYPGRVRLWLEVADGFPFHFGYFLTYFGDFHEVKFQNVCEDAKMLTFLPFMLILSIIAIRKKPKNFKIVAIPFAVSLFFYILTCFTEADVIASKLFLGLGTSVRTHFTAEMGLFYAAMFFVMGNVEFQLSKKKRLVIAVLGTAFVVASLLLTPALHEAISSMRVWGRESLLLLVYGIMGYLLLKNDEKSKSLFILVLAIVSFVGTASVNPVCRGLSDIEDKTLVTAVREIDKENPGRWIASNFVMGSMLRIQGVECLVGTDYYPDLKKWEIIDADGKYKDKKMYNQFLEFSIEPTLGELKMEKPVFTIMQVKMPVETAKKLDVKYYVTNTPLEPGLEEQGKLKKIHEDPTDGWKIYEFVY